MKIYTTSRFKWFDFIDYRKKPCKTRWNYEWICQLGFFMIFKEWKFGNVYSEINKMCLLNAAGGFFNNEKVFIPLEWWSEWEQECKFENRPSNFMGIPVEAKRNISQPVFI